MNLAIFKEKNFSLYLVSTWISSLGDAVFLIALIWLLKSTDSPAIVGSYLFVFGITKSIFILLGGMVVDRIDSRKLMIYTDFIRGVLMILLFVLGLYGMPPLWFFYMIAVIFGTVESVALPAEIASGTRVVNKEDYAQAMSLLLVAGNISAIIGPMIGAGLVYLGGSQIAFLVNGLSFGVSAVLLLFVKFKPVEDKSVQTFKGILLGLWEGWRYFFKTSIIKAMAAQAFFANAAFGATIVAVPFLAGNLGYGVKGYGLMNTGLGVGSAVCAVVFSLFVIKKPKPYMVLLAVIFQGMTIVFVGLFHALWLMIALYALIGAAEAGINILAPSVNHVIIPQKMFGRVLSIMILIMDGSVPISQAIAGWSMESVSPDIIFIGAGLVEIMAAVGTYLVPAVRNYKP